MFPFRTHRREIVIGLSEVEKVLADTALIVAGGKSLFV